MNPRPRRRHGTEFKLQVVQAYLDGGVTQREIARRYEVSLNLIQIWLHKYLRGVLTEEEYLEEKTRDYEAKIAALERKVGQLTMEVEALRRLSARVPSANGLKPPAVSGPAVLPSNNGMGPGSSSGHC
ncbi:MAG: transposase [Steroidobacteraceae bacterium]